MMKLRLALEPRPISTWGLTLANRLEPSEWRAIRNKVLKDAEYACEICGENALHLHCHEMWAFDDRKKIQRLVGLKCVCETCHDVIHFGRSRHVYKKNYVQVLIRHWCKINKKTKADFELHLQETRQEMKKRADKQYVVVAGSMILT